MRPTERSARKPSLTTGLRATLRGLLHTRGSGAPSRPRALATMAALATALGALAFMSAPALALKEHTLSGSFGSSGSGAGQFFLGTGGLAVNEVTPGVVGDVYIGDEGNGRVEWFSPGGKEFKGQFNGTETPAGRFAPSGIAIDNSKSLLDPSVGDVYVVDAEHSVVDKFEADGKYVSQISTGAEGQPLTAIRAVTVDPEGRVWVSYSNNTIASYSSTSNEFISAINVGVHFYNEIFAGFQFPPGEGLAVDSNGNLYAWGESEERSEEIFEFDNTGSILDHKGGRYEIPRVGNAGAAVSVAVDSQNEVFIDERTSVAVYRSAPNDCAVGVQCILSERLPLGSASRISGGEIHGGAIAVDSATGMIYVAEPYAEADVVKVFTSFIVPTAATAKATNITKTSMTLEGTVDPEGEGVTFCQFEYGTTSGYGSAALCSPSEPGNGSSPVAVHADVSGLKPGEIYHFRLVAVNENGYTVGVDETAETALSLPALEGESTSYVGVTEALLSADLASDGLPTTYHVEYGTTTAYGSVTPEVNVGDPREAVVATARLEGLKPDVEYHYRFVAVNAEGTTLGPDMTFTTAPYRGASSSLLPDDRGFELVSSPTSNENVYPPHQEVLESHGKEGANNTNAFVRAAAGGEKVVYEADPPPSGGGSGITGGETGNAYIAERGPEGWTQTLLQISDGQFYEGFSSELSVGVFNPEGAGGRERFRVSGPATPSEPADCTNDALFAYTSDDGGYHSLVGETPNGGPAYCEGEFGGGNEGTATVPQFSHILFQSPFVLTPEALPLRSEEGQYNLYVSVGGRLHLVSVLPDGDPAVYGGKFAGIESPNDNKHTGQDGAPNDISADGSRVFWSPVGGISEMYVRENDTQPQSPVVNGRCTDSEDACTIQIDAKQEGAEGESGGGSFQVISRDGSKVFFTDESRLTVGSTAVPGEPDLYEYEVNAEAGKPGRLTDLTVDGHAGEHADVNGVMGASEDGGYLYFVANGVLTSGKNAEGREPVAGGPNLYVWHEGATAFLATASVALEPTPASNQELGIGDLAGAGHRTAEVTSDGGSLVFRSRTSLTGYRNEGQPEVFVYDRETGRIACASCNPTGAPPVGGVLPEGEGGYLTASERSNFTLRWMSENGGRVFFVTAQPLVPQDINGLQDVYEWERPASEGEPDNSCTTSSADYSGVNGGCVYLLSGGTSSDYSFLLDASADGNDVFIRTRAKLAPQSHNENMALYDVRVGGGSPETRVPCTGTGCQGVPPGQPIFSTPASVTFNGVGNFPSSPPVAKTTKKPARCAKGKKLRAGRCVKKKAKARKAGRNRSKKNGRKS
jgi:hypothetical protein